MMASSMIQVATSSAFGDISSVRNQLAGGVRHVYSNEGAYAAVKPNFSVVTWGSH